MSVSVHSSSSFQLSRNGLITLFSPPSHQERQVQDPGRAGGAGAAAPRWRSGHPHSQEGGVLCLPHGKPRPLPLLVPVLFY